MNETTLDVNKTELFERMPIRKAVLKQVAPSVISQMIVLIYNLADAFFVGLLDSPVQTASITIVGVTFVLLTAISNLFGIGGASALSRALGVKDYDRARNVSRVSFWGGVISSVLFCGLYALALKPILLLCGASSETFDTAKSYAIFGMLLGGPFTILNSLLANLIRAQGNSVHASIGVSLGGILNVILDPFFVLPQFLGLKAQGAGIATAISAFCSFIYFLLLVLFTRKKAIVSLKPVKFSTAKELLPVILAIGLPSALQFVLTMVANMAHTKFISKYSTASVAGFGIVKKLDQLPLFFSLGVANGMLPLLAYNHASGNVERRRQAFTFGVSVAVGFSVICLIAYEIFAPHLVAIFIGDELTVNYGKVFLRIMVTGMPLMAVSYALIIQFQAMKKVKQSIICSVLRKGAVDIPLLFLMDAVVPLYGICAVQPIVDFIALVVALCIYIPLVKKERKELLQSSQVSD